MLEVVEETSGLPVECARPGSVNLCEHSFIVGAARSGAGVSLGVEWFDVQQPILVSRAERPFLDRRHAAYTDYLGAAAAIHEKIYPTRQSVTRLVEFATLERCSQRILDLGLHLSKAHQQSMDALQDQSLHSLNLLSKPLIPARSTTSSSPLKSPNCCG
jgi:hypothetical protein